MRTYITLIVFISIAIISFWLRQDLVKDTEKDKQVNTHFPDYFMENFTITNMNKQGQIEYELEATKMIHFDDDDSAELTQPILNFKQESFR